MIRLTKMTHQNGFPGKHYLHPRAIFHPAPCKRKSQLHTNNKKTNSGVLPTNVRRQKKKISKDCLWCLLKGRPFHQYHTMNKLFWVCLWTWKTVQSIKQTNLQPRYKPTQHLDAIETNQETKVRVSCPLNSHTTKLQENLKICQTSRGNRCYIVFR
jgi:hypothetical protein